MYVQVEKVRQEVALLRKYDHCNPAFPLARPPWYQSVMDSLKLADIARQKRLCLARDDPVPNAHFLSVDNMRSVPVHYLLKKRDFESGKRAWAWAQYRDMAYIPRSATESRVTLWLSSRIWEKVLSFEYTPRGGWLAADAQSTIGGDVAQCASTVPLIVSKPDAEKEFHDLLDSFQLVDTAGEWSRSRYRVDPLLDALFPPGTGMEPDDDPGIYADKKYTRAPLPDEGRLMREYERSLAQPANWLGMNRDDFMEGDDGVMRQVVSTADRARMLAGQCEVFWDYANARNLHVQRHSSLGLELGFAHAQQGEKRLVASRQGGLRWLHPRHRKVFVESGSIWGSRPSAYDSKVANAARVKSSTWAAASSAPGYSEVTQQREIDNLHGNIANELQEASKSIGGGTEISIVQYREHDVDPVYGENVPKTSGRDAETVLFNGCSLRRADVWPEREGKDVDEAAQARAGELRRFLLWEANLIAQRHQIADLDEHILVCRGRWDKHVAGRRVNMWERCWGEPSWIPAHTLSPPSACSPDYERRLDTVAHLGKLMQEWPEREDGPPRPPLVQDRCDLFENGQRTLSPEAFLEYEREVWLFYAQSCVDYLRVVPWLHFERPAVPAVLQHFVAPRPPQNLKRKGGEGNGPRV